MICLLGACIIAAQLTGGGLYHEDTPSGTYQYTDEVTQEKKIDSFDRFYEVENTQFSVGGYLILDNDIRIDLMYDNGLESPKRTRSKSLSVGLTKLVVIDEDSHITFGGSTRLGGRLTEISCRDEDAFDKEFFCYNPGGREKFSQPENKRDYKVFFTYNKSFNWFLGTKETIGEK